MATNVDSFATATNPNSQFPNFTDSSFTPITAHPDTCTSNFFSTVPTFYYTHRHLATLCPTL